MCTQAFSQQPPQRLLRVPAHHLSAPSSTWLAKKAQAWILCCSSSPQKAQHPAHVQMFESRTGRAASEFLQPLDSCPLSPFGSCHEALEELCPSSIMEAVLATSEATATGHDTSCTATAAAQQLLGSSHVSPSQGRTTGPQQQQGEQTRKQGAPAPAQLGESGAAERQPEEQLSLSMSTSKSSSSSSLNMFDSGDGFGAPNMVSLEL